VAEKFDLTHIHHVNVLVHDIETAKQRYRDIFNVKFIDEPLPSRGVLTSRFSLGDSWFVLVQPVAEGEPMRQLRERGEGLFLLSFGVAQTERPARDGVYSFDASAEVREGISGWRVVDLKMDGMSTCQLQLAFGQND
jgi:catechol 2,3-dioxygenase-like lactoylglutathione lyase family enzyme